MQALTCADRADQNSSCDAGFRYNQGSNSTNITNAAEYNSICCQVGWVDYSGAVTDTGLIIVISHVRGTLRSGASAAEQFKSYASTLLGHSVMLQQKSIGFATEHPAHAALHLLCMSAAWFCRH